MLACRRGARCYLMGAPFTYRTAQGKMLMDQEHRYLYLCNTGLEP